MALALVILKVLAVWFALGLLASGLVLGMLDVRFATRRNRTAKAVPSPVPPGLARTPSVH